jgi:hypothetical protein
MAHFRRNDEFKRGTRLLRSEPLADSLEID